MMCWRDIELFRATQALRSSRLPESASSHHTSDKENLQRELRRINLEALARMGDQHLRSHPETSPVEEYAAPCDRWGEPKTTKDRNEKHTREYVTTVPSM